MAKKQGRSDYTDDASLVTPFAAVKMVLGDKKNIKVTVPEDVELAEGVTEGIAWRIFPALGFY